MRVRPHVEPVAGTEFGRPQMVEEDKKPTHTRRGGGQRAPPREAVAKIDCTRHHHMRDSVAGIGIAGGRILTGEKAHLTFHTWSRQAFMPVSRRPVPSAYRVVHRIPYSPSPNLA